MKTLVLPEHPRKWDRCLPLCRTCGEHHPMGTPTPSGRVCSGPAMHSYRETRVGAMTSMEKKVLESKAALKAERKCTICEEYKPPAEFNGPYSRRCIVCCKKNADNSKERQKIARDKWRANNADKIAAWQKAAGKKWREKRDQLRKEEREAEKTKS